MTKRQMGLSFIIMGIVAASVLLLIDLFGAGNFQGIGPAQRLALVGSGLLIILGITLLPLGDKPA